MVRSGRQRLSDGAIPTGSSTCKSRPNNRTHWQDSTSTKAGKGVPPHSHRWSRWRLEYWNGEWWDPLMKEELDAAIDAQIEKEKANGSR